MKAFLITSVFIFSNILALAQSIKSLNYAHMYHFFNDTIIVATSEFNIETSSYNIILGNLENDQESILNYKNESLSTLQYPTYIKSHGSFFLIKVDADTYKILKYLPDAQLDVSFGVRGEITIVIPTKKEVGIFSFTKNNQDELYVYGDFLGEEGFRKVFINKYLCNGIMDGTFGDKGVVVLENDPAVLGVKNVSILKDGIVVVMEYAAKIEGKMKVIYNLTKLDNKGNEVAFTFNYESHVMAIENDNHAMYVFCKHKVVMLDLNLKIVKEYEGIENSVMSRAIAGNGLKKNLIVANRGVLSQSSFNSVIYELSDNATIYYEPVSDNLKLFIVDYYYANDELKLLCAV
ncbi:MAG: hypothetical protein ACTHJT_16685, partial [Cytophaga sp.]|uniref:hypothetical protein n=1 Tax=Cytophaga sp. TaxID=29535 RepID=UPI003F7D5533